MTFSWSERDEWRWLTGAAVGAVGGAVALALFGLPAIDIHSPLHYAGIMDPLCGMTRAVRLLALGRFSDAWRFNPASFLLVLATGAVLARAVIGFITRRWAHVYVSRRGSVTAVVALFVSALWINQQLHAALLMSTAH